MQKGDVLESDGLFFPVEFLLEVPVEPLELEKWELVPWHGFLLPVEDLARLEAQLQTCEQGVVQLQTEMDLLVSILRTSTDILRAKYEERLQDCWDRLGEKEPAIVVSTEWWEYVLWVGIGAVGGSLLVGGIWLGTVLSP